MQKPHIKNYLLIFLFCYALILGTSYTMYVHYDFSHSTDTKSYLKLAEGNYQVTSTHRYRVIIPGLAAAIAVPVKAVYHTLWPHRPENQWPLRLSFYLVNSLFLALAGTIIFFTCLQYKASAISSLIAVTAVLTSRWAAYIGGLPLIDSLYIVIISLIVYGLKARSREALVVCIFVGPFAKESFIFIAPLILFFGRNILSLRLQIPLFILSGTIVFSFRYFIDHNLGVASEQSILNAIDNKENFIYTFHRIFAIRGLGEMLSVFGIFTFILFAGLLGKTRKEWTALIDTPCYWLLASIIVHIFLSGDAGRMFYLYCPVFAIMVALILDKHEYFSGYRKLIQEK
jgi:hypothetical protein